MKRELLVTLAAIAIAAGACGTTGTEAAPTPTPGPTSAVTGRIMGPADDARNTVDELNRLQQQNLDRTGGGAGGESYYP